MEIADLLNNPKPDYNPNLGKDIPDLSDPEKLNIDELEALGYVRYNNVDERLNELYMMDWYNMPQCLPPAACPAGTGCPFIMECSADAKCPPGTTCPAGENCPGESLEFRHHETCPCHGKPPSEKNRRGPKPSSTRTRDFKGTPAKKCPRDDCAEHIYGRWSDMRRHLRIHLRSEEKPYICLWDGCRQTDSQPDNFIAHFKQHIDFSKPYEEWDNWCGMTVQNADGTTRECKFRYNSPNRLARHRHGNDLNGRHSGKYFALPPAPDPKTIKRPIRRPRKRTRQNFESDQANELGFRRVIIGKASAVSSHTPATDAPANPTAHRKPKIARLAAYSATYVESTPAPPSARSALRASYPVTPIASAAGPSASDAPLPYGTRAASTPLPSTPSRATSDWTSRSWSSAPPRSTTYRGSITGAFSMMSSDIPKWSSARRG